MKNNNYWKLTPTCCLYSIVKIIKVISLMRHLANVNCGLALCEFTDIRLFNPQTVRMIFAEDGYISGA